MSEPVVAVLAGGISREKEVSLRSADCVGAALGAHFPVEVFRVDEPAVPAGIDAGRHVVFSTLHGIFGEDGGMQRLLEERGIHYAGSDVEASRLCMNKEETKRRVRNAGVAAPRGIRFPTTEVPSPGDIVEQLGPRVVVKPNGEGSSIGLEFAETEGELAACLARLEAGEWLVEERVDGRELTVGVLDGRAMGVVEIIPESGRYDYESKYTRGRTRYRAPAEIPDATAKRIRTAAEIAFARCGCRDFARVDFILPEDGDFRFLEINTLPGLTDTSLLPMSAACEGFDFKELARRLIVPAIARFNLVYREVGS